MISGETLTVSLEEAIENHLLRSGNPARASGTEDGANAYWATVENHVAAEDYTPLLGLVAELRDKIIGLTPRRRDLAEETTEAMDVELLEQMMDYGAFDVVRACVPAYSVVPSPSPLPLSPSIFPTPSAAPLVFFHFFVSLVIVILCHQPTLSAAQIKQTRMKNKPRAASSAWLPSPGSACWSWRPPSETMARRRGWRAGGAPRTRWRAADAAWSPPWCGSASNTSFPR